MDRVRVLRLPCSTSRSMVHTHMLSPQKCSREKFRACGIYHCWGRGGGREEEEENWSDWSLSMTVFGPTGSTGGSAPLLRVSPAT